MTERSRKLDEINWWDFWNTSYRNEDNNDAVSNELFTRTAALINEITQKGNDRVLEIACGAGSLSRLLTFSNYHGIDMSPAAVEIAREKSVRIERPVSAGLPTYEAADFHNWPLPPRPYDVAVCLDAVAYFRDQRLAVSKMVQSLRTSGTLVLSTINPIVYHRIRRTLTQPIEEGPVSRWLSRRELHALVESSGLKIERSFTIMPRGNMGILRLVNSHRLNSALGPHVEAALKHLKEDLGLGQYRIVVARKLG
jgi:2-polyprenyl-3-methyl-5-hydroxy-6-metoxy-1,4-benzoquinol methylase